MKTFILFITMVLTAILGFSQPNSGYNEYQRQEVLNSNLKEILSRKNVEFSKFSETGEVKITSTITKEELISSLTDRDNYQLKLRTTSNRRLKPGSTYFLYDQYFKGLAVEGGGLTIEESVSGVAAMWPKLFDKIDIPVVPRINNSDLEEIFGDIQSSELTISRRFSDAYLLVYKVEFISSGSKVAFVDANTGKVLLEHINGSNLTGTTVDYGTQNLNDRTVGNVTTLETPDENIKVFTDFDASVVPGCAASVIPSTMNTNDWGTDATAHCLQTFFSADLAISSFSTIGINFMNVRFFCGREFPNAISWNCDDFPGASIEMGFDGPTSFSLHDVTAHELGHTFIRQFIDLSFNDDPASIHEGLADVFGTYIEADIQGSVDWVMADDNPVLIPSFGRDLAQSYCLEPFGPGIGVHRRGRAAGHWYYLLSQGDASLEILAFGMDAALDLIRDALAIVGPAPSYQDFAQATLNAAGNTWGMCSDEYRSIVNAWIEVCVLDPMCGDVVLVNPNVQDLVDALCVNTVHELLTANGDVQIVGTFTVDQNLQLTDGVNFYMSENAEIVVEEGILFRKVGGFIEPCDGADWEHIESNGGQYYLYDVDISGAETAVVCNGGSGDIILCDIDDCNEGIRMSGSNGLFISHNHIDAEQTGIFATHASAFVAQTNTIGASSSLMRGIRLDNASDGLINGNTIEAVFNGIESNYSLAGIGRNNVTASSNAGIFSFESRVFIDDNTIDGSGGSGIYFNTNADGNASHNRVSGDFYRMVQMQATQDHLIYANEVSGGGDNGIFNTNSGFNFYECNDLTGPGDYGIFNGGNSILQEFITNQFSGSAVEDFYSTSEFGPQVLTGNESWCEAHATGFTNGVSGFWVSDLTPNCTETPANYTPQLFLPDTTGIKVICGTSPGPGGVPSTTFICWWIEYLSNLPPDRRNFYWVNSYHLIKRFKNNVPESEWPECIWILPLDCGLEKLAEAEVEYMNALSETSNEIKSIRNQYDASISSEDRADNEAYVHALSQARITKEQTLRELRDQQITTLSLLPCDDQMSELYRTVYILRLKNQDEKLNESDLSYLRKVAGMCASEFGDVVHWAMGLLSSYTTELPVTVDDCNEEPIEGRSRSLVNKDVIASKVYPNPVSTELTVDIWGASGQVLLTDITGQVIIRTDLQEGENRINVEPLNSGLYLIKILAEDHENIEKIIVTK